MNVHERLVRALEHEEPDRVPTLAQYFEPGFIRKVLGEMGLISRLKFYLERHWAPRVAFEIGFDSVWLHYNRQQIPKGTKPEIPADILDRYELSEPDVWGLCFQRSARSRGNWYKDGALKTPDLIRAWISFINEWDAGTDAEYDHFRDVWNKYIDKGVVPIPTGGSVAYITWSSIGLNRFAYMTRKHLNLVKDLAMAWGRFTKKQHDRHFERGVDMVFICDDFCMKQRPIYSPKMFDEIVVPVYSMLAKNAHKKGGKLLIHSDGNVSELVPLLVKSGVDAIEPLEYESGARIGPLKDEYGDKITFIGNVAATHVLTFGTIDDTIKETKKQILEAAEGGGYILGAGSDIFTTCKLENVRAMISTVKKFGSYPLNKDVLKT
ncbi:MAG: uroporphyrinogen decarboxylase family protein [Promethearchaeota archaeon]